MNGYKPISVLLIKSTPALDSVARVAFFKLETSNKSLISGVKTILLSLETPFFHSFVSENAPKSSSLVTDFGFKVSYSQSSPLAMCVLTRVFQIDVFPQPGGPMMKQQCLTSKISFN